MSRTLFHALMADCVSLRTEASAHHGIDIPTNHTYVTMLSIPSVFGFCHAVSSGRYVYRGKSEALAGGAYQAVSSAARANTHTSLFFMRFISSDSS